jgi:hypothetical protein
MKQYYCISCFVRHICFPEKYPPKFLCVLTPECEIVERSKLLNLEEYLANYRMFLITFNTL